MQHTGTVTGNTDDYSSMTSFELSAMPDDGAPDEQIGAFLRDLLPDFYFVNTPLSRMRRHLQLLRELPHNPLQIELLCPPGAQFTELILCGYDQAQPGLLAQIAGALSALHINVHTAWIHTLRDPHAPAEKDNAVVLNTFITSENSFRRARPLTQKSCAAIERALRKIIQQQNAPVAVALPALNIDELSVTAAGRYTLIKVSAPNENGVLYAVAHAVAQLELDIAHAQINTFENAAVDTFFVTDAAGEPLEIERDFHIAEQLRALLSGEV